MGACCSRPFKLKLSEFDLRQKHLRQEQLRQEHLRQEQLRHENDLRVNKIVRFETHGPHAPLFVPRGVSVYDMACIEKKRQLKWAETSEAYPGMPQMSTPPMDRTLESLINERL